MQTGKFRGFEVAIHDLGIAMLTFNQPERLNGMTHHRMTCVSAASALRRAQGERSWWRWNGRTRSC